jgi:hypothetical protein
MVGCAVCVVFFQKISGYFYVVSGVTKKRKMSYHVTAILSPEERQWKNLKAQQAV